MSTTTTRPVAVRRSSAPSTRRARAAESFRTAAECIGPIVAGLSLFAVTRGQFSMVDAVVHVINELGPSRVSLWTWTIADYEVNVFNDLMRNDKITAGRLIIDQGARMKNRDLIRAWQGQFGSESVRYVLNHAKIATIEGGGRRVLVRGSMNLNFNPRFEQLDVTEGGPDFDLVREIESELPVLSDDASGADAYRASRVSEAFNKEELALFSHLKVWAK